MSKLKVSSKDIFPLIKKFLYNDQDIFLRELVSNAVDATQKLITLSNKGEYTGAINKEVIVQIDIDNNILSIIDNGIGMTKEEVEKYICQIAFSSAEEFIKKHKDADIIGHFGMGFYSAFMVADKVEIRTLSYKENSNIVYWSCDGSVSYELVEYTKDEATCEHCGTSVTLHISEDYKEYFTVSHIKSLLTKYNKFIKIPVKLVEITSEYTDSSTEEIVKPDNIETIITSDNPLWTKSPAELTDEDYIKFYHELYPYKPDPLFWLHLNVDHPFTFTGILYFPAYDKTKPIFEKTNLHLYCNQVFVTNNLEGILPEYLRLLHGIIDSPDIPLNMSRSEAQSDTNVKKIKSYISTKVMSSLKKLVKNDRDGYEKKWDTIKSFINLGIIMENDVWDKAKDIVLLTDIDNNHYTFDEYYDKVKVNQTDKDNNVIFLYTTDKDAQYSYIHAAQRKDYNILLMDNPYNAFEAQSFEIEYNNAHKDIEGWNKIKFQRVDTDVIDKLICKEEVKSEISDNVKNMLLSLFTACTPEIKGYRFKFVTDAFSIDNVLKPISIITDEVSRRIQDMHKINNEGFAINSDIELTFVLDTNSFIIKDILKKEEEKIGDTINLLNNKLQDITNRRKTAEDNNELTDELKETLQSEYNNITKEKNELITEYAQRNATINDLIKLGLLQYGLLSGNALFSFVQNQFRSLIK